MSAAVEPGTGHRLVRAILLVLLILVGLALGAVAGLFIADWLGWVPKFSLC